MDSSFKLGVIIEPREGIKWLYIGNVVCYAEVSLQNWRLMKISTSMRIMAIGLSLVVFTSGCGNDNGSNQTSSAVRSKNAQPVVAIVPVFDRTENNDVSWNLSDELTTILS